MLHQYDDKYFIALYCNSSEFKSDVGADMLKKYPLGDFSCIWNYDLNKNQTYFSLRSTNDRMDVSIMAQRYGGGGHRNASGFMIEGLVGCLPLYRINDYGIIDLLLNVNKGKMSLDGKMVTYSLFVVHTIRTEWFESKLYNLLKQKCADSQFIVFQKNSTNIKIIQNDVVNQKEYTVYFNEHAVSSPQHKLQYMVCCKDNPTMSFVDHRDFHKIFSDQKN